MPSSTREGFQVHEALAADGAAREFIRGQVGLEAQVARAQLDLRHQQRALHRGASGSP